MVWALNLVLSTVPWYGMLWYGLMPMTVELYVPPLLALRASKRCQKDPGSVDSMCSSTILIPPVTEH
jgi:hypothetical protein